MAYKKIYNCYNLMESTVRINLVSLAKIELAKKETVKTMADFDFFVEELFTLLSNFDKFEALGTKDKIVEEVIEDMAAEVAMEAISICLLQKLMMRSL